jgi:hypothetical protein
MVPLAMKEVRSWGDSGRPLRGGNQNSESMRLNMTTTIPVTFPIEATRAEGLVDARQRGLLPFPLQSHLGSGMLASHMKTLESRGTVRRFESKRRKGGMGETGETDR